MVTSSGNFKLDCISGNHMSRLCVTVISIHVNVHMVRHIICVVHSSKCSLVWSNYVIAIADTPQFRGGNPYFFSENLYQSVSFIYASMYRTKS